MNKIIKLTLIVIALVNLVNSECLAAVGHTAQLQKAEACVSQSQTALKKCNEDLIAKETAKVGEEEMALIRQIYTDEIKKLTEEHRMGLNEKDQTIFGLSEAIQRAIDEASCDNFPLVDHEAYGEFLAKLAIQQFFEESKAKSAQTILVEDELFWQYLSMNFPEFKAILKAADDNKTMKFVRRKANFFVQRVRSSMAALMENMGLNRGVTGIIIDENKYKEEKAIPPTLVHGEAPNYIELHIAPANADGVSNNIFNKFDTTHLEGLLLINSPNEQALRDGFSTGNDNFQFSLTDNPEASVILIQIDDLDPMAGTYLQGLIEVVGEKAEVVIDSTPGVSIDGAFFRNLNSLEIKSHDLDDFSGCQSFPCARNIRVGFNGLYADSRVTFNSKHAHIDGPIFIPEKILFFDVQGTCIFNKDGKINKLGGLDAVCATAFINHGNIKVQGPAKIETANFVNEALWYWANWTQEMKDALPEEIRRGFMIIDEHQKIPFDDIDGRQYEKMLQDSGIMLAYNYLIKITQGDFQNRNGGQMRATAPNRESSKIFAKNEISNTYKQAFNQAGYYKEGSTLIPSIINFSGDTEFYSETSRIINHGSTININGNSTIEAATDIINQDVSVRYYDHLFCKLHGRPKKHHISTDVFKEKQCAMPGKPGMCLGRHGYPYVNELSDVSHNYVDVSSPALFMVQGGKSHRQAKGNINDIGSVFYSEAGSSDKAEGNFILEGKKHDLVSIQKTIARIADLVPGGDVALTKLTGTALSPSIGNQPFSITGFHFTRGISETEAGEEIKILNGATHASEKGTKMRPQGNFYLEGFNEAHLAGQIRSKNARADIYAFVTKPAVVESLGNIDIQAPNAGIYLKAGQILSFQDITMSANSIEVLPLTTIAENSYWTKKNSLLGSSTATVRSSTSSTINSVIHGKGKVTFNADTLSLEGSIIRGDKEIELNVDVLKLKVHLIDHCRITDTESKRFFFPGLGNILLDLANGDFSSKSISNNIGIVAAVDRLLNTKSASDMAPSILMAAETYSMADGFSRAYDATGSEMAAMTSTVLDQLQFTTVGGVPVPTSVGYGETKTHRESKWQEVVLPIISGGNVKIKSREVHVDGAQFNAEKDFNLTVTENLYLHGQPVTSSESFRQDGKSVTFSFSNSGVSVSGNVQNAKANSHMIQQILPEIIAGNSVNIDIAGNAEIEGIVSAPIIKVKVGGQLLIKTVQDVGEGSSSQKSVNAGVSVSSAGVTPSGGFKFGNGDWFRRWANQQAGIMGTNVEIDVETLILEGARIIGQLGHVNADSVEYKNIVNTYESEFSEFGVDTNFLNFLMDPKNAPRVVSAANAIKGMAVFGNEDESAYQTLFATISQNLNVNTNSNIDGLNRDDSKAEGPVHKSSHKFSLALPVVDFKELGEGLQRIGITARDINQKRLDALKSQRVEFMESEPEKAAEWQEVIENQEKIFERIEESNLSPEEKEKLSQRIFLLFTDPGQYFVRGKSRPNEQGTLKVDINNEEHIEAAYQPNDGMILTVDKPSGYDEETYNNVAEVLGQEVANDLRDARSRWAKIASAAYQFGKGVLVISKEPLEAKPGFGSESVFELFIEALEDPRNEEVAKAGAELVHNIYEGLIELWENQQFQGGVKVVGGVIEVGIGKAMVVGGGVGSVITGGAGAPIGIPVAILGAVVAGHGVDQIGTGFTQILMNQEVPSVMVGAFEEMGFSPEDSRNMGMYFAMGIPFAASHQFLNIAGRSIELGFNAIRRTSQQSVPMFFKAGTCPRVIGLMEKEVYTATNPLKLKQIPASTAKKLEEIRHLPPLRQEYIKEVWELKRTVHKLYKEGKTSEEVARTVSQMRRDLGIKYKDMTPPELREIIYKSNIEEYNDPLGPTIEYFRKEGRSWEQIIESACKEHGRGLPGTV